MLVIGKKQQPRKRHSRKHKYHRYGSSGLDTTLRARPDAHQTSVRLMAYTEDGVEERENPSIEDIREFLEKYTVTWIDVAGLADVERLQEFVDFFKLHRLAMEDVLWSQQYAKTEEFDDHLFVVIRMPPDVENDDINTDQLSLFCGDKWVLSFQEIQGDCLDDLRLQIREGRGRMRHLGPDFLMYSLLDSTLDAYFPLLESYGEQMEVLEDRALLYPTPQLVSQLYDQRHKLLAVRRALWPVRDAVNHLVRLPEPKISKETSFFLRDLYDHAVQIIDLIESYRDLAGNLTDAYLSSVSNRMNSIMKVLTIISTTFMPLAFLTGLYGMNFNTSISRWNMPELNWRYGYVGVLAVMVLITAIQFYMFWRRGWIGKQSNILEGLTPVADMELARVMEEAKKKGVALPAVPTMKDELFLPPPSGRKEPPPHPGGETPDDDQKVTKDQEMSPKKELGEVVKLGG